MRKNKWMSFNFISIRYNYSLHTYGNRKYGESPLPPFDVMFLQSERSSKTFAIDFTHIWFFSSVSTLMFRQTAGCCKPFVTDFTHKWFLSSVGTLMFRQMARCCKQFVTDFAH